jgi:DnaK suppressor protein
MASNQRTSPKASAAGSSKKGPARSSTARAAKAPARKPARPAPVKAARKAAPKTARPAPKPAKAAPKPAKAAAKPAKAPAKAARPAAARPAKSSTPQPPAARDKAPARKPAPVAPRRGGPAAPESAGTGLIHGIPPYHPTAGEKYMNERQLEHFRQVLLAWKRELMEEVDRTVHHMQDEASNFPDPNDRATQESEFGLELRTRDRERKLLKKIDSALERIDDGSYGFCEETGEEIGLKRLEARPVATLSLEAQERREMAEKQYGERDDRFR